MFFKEIKKIHNENLKKNKSYLEEQEWLSLAHTFQLIPKDFLFTMLDFAKQFSEIPISHYQVGAIGIGLSNKLYMGANIEFTQCPLNESIHAEQSLVSLAYAQGEKGIKEIYLTAFPCGHCRQFLREMANFNEVKVFNKTQKEKTFYLPELIPHSFGPQDLNITQSLFTDNSDSLVNSLVNSSIKISDVLKSNLLLATKKSYAPYSKNPSGVVLEFSNSDVVLGSYLESCAYNPSLSPFHMAYAQVALSKRNFSDLKAVYLVEMENAQISHEININSLLQKLAPHAKFYSIKFK